MMSALVCLVLAPAVASCDGDNEMGSAKQSIPNPNDAFPAHDFSVGIVPLENSTVIDPTAGQITINADQFLETLESQVFIPHSMGYAIALLQDSELLGLRVGGYAKAPQDGGLAWDEYTKLHVASTTKALTTMAVLSALHDQDNDVSALIHPYLPDYWEKGPQVDGITFFQLLTHRTGLALGPRNGPASFDVAKQLVANGNHEVAAGHCGPPDPFDGAPTEASADAIGTLGSVPTEHDTDIDSVIPLCPGDPRYQNPMFVVARIVATMLDGRVDQDVCQNEPDQDACWNSATTEKLLEMLDDRVFAPAGLAGIDVGRTENFALAYSSADDVEMGDARENNLLRRVGAVGIYLNITELAQLIGAFVSTDGVVSTADRIDMLRFLFGYTWDYIDPADSQTILVRDVEYRLPTWGGSWGNRPQREKNTIFFYPGNIQMIVMYNSELPAQIPNASNSNSRSLYRWVRCAYINSVTEGANPASGCP